MTARRIAWVAAIAVLALVRLASLDAFPLSHPDEGGWPLSVRAWVESGTHSRDYYMAPGYHWLLGIPFYLFGSVHSVSRPVSALVSLLTLYLFYRLSGRLAGRPTAIAATLLLGTSYPAVLLDRRALIEPFQMALIVALCLIVAPFVHPSDGGQGSNGQSQRWRYPLAAAVAALLLLTKASGGFILPAIAVALVWPWRSPFDWKPRAGVLAALAAGVAAAAGFFWYLYANDPVNFLTGWQADMRHVNIPGTRPDGSGRFAIHPASIERTIRWFSDYEPMLFGLALLGFLKAVWERKHTLMAAWLAIGAAFLFVQLYVQENHRAILLPPLCFFAAYLLAELHDLLRANEGGARRWTWAQAAVALMIAYSLARLGIGLARTTPAELAATRWLSAHATPQSRVMAAPYVLMRLRGQGVPFWSLTEPYLPTTDQLRRWQPDWLVLETEEWRSEEAKFAPPAALEQALAECCEIAFTSPGATVYRVKQESLALGK